MLAIIFILQARKIIILPARPPAGESRGRSLEVLEDLESESLRRLQRMREKSFLLFLFWSKIGEAGIRGFILKWR